MQNLINLTPHAISVYGPDGVIDIPPSGQLCRVRSSQEAIGLLAGIPVYEQSFDAVEGLPDPQEGHIFIVSSLVLRALAEMGESRGDVVAPGTGPQDGCVRDTSGRILGVTRFTTSPRTIKA